MSRCSQPVDHKGQWFEKALGVQVHQMSSEAIPVWHAIALLIFPFFTFWLCRIAVFGQHSRCGQLPSDPTAHLWPALAQHILDMPEMQHNKWDCFFPHMEVDPF